MTKHLRLIMLSLLAMICMGGYSAVGDTYKLVTSVNDLHDGDVIVIANSEYNKAMGMQRTSNRGSVLISFTDKSNETFNCVANVAELTLKKTSDDKWQFLIDGHFLYAAGSGKDNYLKQTDDKAEKASVATIVFDVKNATIKFESNNRNTIRYNSSKGLFSCYAFNSQEAVQIYKKQNSNLTPTNTTFGEGVDNNTFEVKDGEIVETRVATVTPGEATGSGSIVYESSDEAIAKVDAKTGAITLGAKYGTAVITAKFVAKGSFANSEASYSIKHVGDFVFYESFDKCDGTGGNDDTFSGSIAFNDWKAEKLDEVWTKSGKVYLGNKCIRIGKDASSVTTSSIEYTGKSILTFKAAAWSTDDTKVQLTITGGTLKYGESEPTTSVSFNPTKGEWQTFEMEVTSTGPFTLQFANETTSRRFFLDEVMIKKVNAASPKEITLDENGDNIVEKAENVNVTLKRTLYGDGGWNTLCVPFTLTEAQTKAAFGNNVELRELESVAGNTLTFKTVNSVTANVPCLIKVTAAGNEYKFEGVSTTAVKNNRDYTLSLVEGNILFLGIYSAMDVVEADLAGSSTNGYYAFLGANNTFFKAKAGSTMKAFRAFFSVPNDVNTKQLKAVIDGTTTGIEDLVIDGVKANGRVYNLNGQYVGNSLNGLQPGFYIQNGKKIVIK